MLRARGRKVKVKVKRGPPTALFLGSPRPSAAVGLDQRMCLYAGLCPRSYVASPLFLEFGPGSFDQGHLIRVTVMVIVGFTVTVAVELIDYGYSHGCSHRYCDTHSCGNGSSPCDSRGTGTGRPGLFDLCFEYVPATCFAVVLSGPGLGSGFV